MQSTSLKTAQPIFPRDAVRVTLVVLSAIALVAFLVFALAIVRSQAGTSAGPRIDGDRPPIELPGAVPGALTAPDLEAGHDALDDLFGASGAEQAPLADQIRLADTYRWVGSYAPRAEDHAAPNKTGRGAIPQ